jgi:hypothetical protein
MKFLRFFFVFLLFPFYAFSQSAIIRNIYPIVKRGHRRDTIKSISYVMVECKGEAVCKRINRTMGMMVMGVPLADTMETGQKLADGYYKGDKYKRRRMAYRVTYNKNGFLSITFNMVNGEGEVQAPVYLNFDMGTGGLITISDMLNTKNDSISFRQSVITEITDSVRLFEQSIDRNNAKYGEIIEHLNGSLSEWRSNYISDFSMGDGELTIYYDCMLPDSLMHYGHRYRVAFRYKTLRNVFKPDIIKRLE